MKFTIKRCYDMELLKKVHLEIFLIDDWYKNKNKNAVYWLAWCDNKPVGYCIASVIPSEDACFLARAGVCKEYRGHGLQKKLIKVREVYCKKIGIKKMITYTLVENIASNRNLQKCGYWLYLPQNYWAGKETLYWYKDLGK